MTVVMGGGGAIRMQATFQPASLSGEDAQIYEGTPDDNFGIKNIMNTGLVAAGNAASRARALIRFFYILPPGALIQSAILTLACTSVANITPRNVNIHRSLVQWYEGASDTATPSAGVDASTWEHRNYNGSVNWDSAGGSSGVDYVATPTATTLIANTGVYTFDVTADIKYWQTNANLGWWILGTIDGTLATYKQFATSDNATATNYPKLVITYTIKSPFLSGGLSRSTQLADMPAGVNQHGFEELNGILYAVGGENSGLGDVQTLYAYDPVANSWATKTNLPIKVQSPVVRAVGNKLYCIGGLDESQICHADTYEYDPVGNTWTKKSNMPTAREDMGSAVVNGKIYVFGGLGATAGVPTSALEIYDPSIDQWSSATSMPVFKHLGDFGAAVNGKIYAIGGTNTMLNYPTLYPDTRCYVYDPTVDIWTRIADIPVSTCYKEACVLNGKIYIFTGCTISTTTFTDAAYTYDPISGQWALAGILTPYSARGTGTCVYNGEIYICGGYTNTTLKNLYKLS